MRWNLRIGGVARESRLLARPSTAPARLRLLAACFAAGAMAAVVCPPGLDGQTTTGKILGVVQDQTQAVIPGATVRVTNTGTNVTTTATTSESGFYEFLNLPPAEYQLEAEFKGFKKFVQRGIVLQVNQQARIDITLQPGQIVEVVEVTGRAALLETTTSTVGQVITQREVHELPLNGRNPFQLLMLSTGVTGLDGGTGSGQKFVAGFFGGFVQGATLNGGRQGMTEVYMDGAPDTFSDNGAGSLGVAYSPSVDSLQEFKVITNNMSAEFGNAGSGVVNIATRSGTNDFHGTIFEFHRNSVLDSNNFFNNRAGIDLKSFKRNQFGGNLGGPIRRDKTFFFVDYEGTRERAADTTTRTVPLQAWRDGDFSGKLTGDVSLTDCLGRSFDTGQVFNPFTTREVTCLDGSTGFVRDPFPNNIIPDSLKSATAMALLDFWPAPNQPGAFNNFIASGSAVNTSDQFGIRLDHQISHRQRMMGRYSHSRGYNAPPNYFGNIADPAFFPFPSASRLALFEHSINLSPTTLLTTGLSYSRNRFETQSGGAGFEVTEINMVPSWNDALTIHQFPLFNFLSVSGLGGGFVGSRQVAERFSLRETLTRIQGRHSMKFGAQIDIMRTSEGAPAWPSGTYDFGPGFTGGPDPFAPGADTGHDFATFLLGLPGTAVSQDVFRAMQSWYYGFYFQDDIKVSRKLTLNVGVRYDLAIPYTERYDRATWFDASAQFPFQLPAANLQAMVDGAAALGITLTAEDLGRLSQLRGGERFAEQDPGRHVFDTDFNNIAPRFGFAYQLSDNTVLRGGGGIFYGPSPTAAQGTSGPFNIDGFGTLQSGVSTQPDGVTPLCNPADPSRAYCLENPIPTGLTPLLGSSKGLLTFFDPAGFIISMGRDLPNPVNYNWNFGIQRQLPGNVLVGASYVGSRGLRFATGSTAIAPFNQLHRSTVEKFRGQLFELVPNPFFGLVSDAAFPLNLPELDLGSLLVDHPQFVFGGFLTYWPLNGKSSYHAFQLRVEKQFSHGLSFLASYTNSKNIDNGEGTLFNFGSHSIGPQDIYDYRLEKSLAGQDVSQRLVFSHIWELPFGKGRRFTLQNPVGDAILGGWQLNGILTLGRGTPVVWGYYPVDPRVTIGTMNVRMDKTCADPRLSGPINIDRYFNTDCFADPAPFTLGTAPRTDPQLRLPGVRQLDFSLFKNFKVSENWRAQLRAEFFNLTNTPRFSSFREGPFGGGTFSIFGHPKFGVLDTQANEPRKIQFGLKISF